MIISKVFNNNAVLVKDENQIEKIVMGCGLAFKKKSGDHIDESKIDKVFLLSNDEANNKFKELVMYIPFEYIEFGEEVIKYAQGKLGETLNENVYISLIDHMYSAIKRYKEGIMIKNVILWEIKRFYKDEYNIGLKALEMIKERFSVSLLDDEAAFIAIHIAESRKRQETEDMYKTTEIMSEILNIVKYYFNISFDEDSIYYYRFITHLKFFVQRLLENKLLEGHGDDTLLELVKTKYINSYNCVEKINDFISKKYKYDILDEEKLYLVIHIERLVYKSEK